MKIAHFLKNLCFVVFHNAIISFFWGIYEIGQKNRMIGFLLFFSSAILLFFAGLIASYYHKRNIHVNKIGFRIGIITAIFFLFAVVISKIFLK